ncbi:spore germination protein [Sporanaerobacter acetigenes]|uniref:Spore germination protein n=1 Tax=Sporanaerobacter acetigenes DSM 13106 TaxID=1123281 RepID=A0A1M5VJT0_9FIRM|nr:spore germination protein [Sporanaerobacter acetigenes]SHH75509.1 spore germination protein [Sporanaerobacter acetigenes DSM 13106]
MDLNVGKVKEILKDCDDVVYRDFKVGVKQNFSLCIVYVDGLINKESVSDFVLESLMEGARGLEPTPKGIKDNLIELITKGNISITEIEEVSTIEETIDAILSGETALFIDKYDKAIILSSRGWPTRSINESQSETVVRGPRDAFTETLKVNITLIRRRIKDPNLKVKMVKIGRRSKTDVAVMYIEDIVNDGILGEVFTRLGKVDVDAIVESAILEEHIQDDYYSPFPQIENTERPDSVAASLYEGRIALVVDNTPSVLVVPATIGTIMQSSEDYYTRWVVAGITRIIRYIAAAVAVLAPGLYIAVTSFHPGLLPTRLAFYVAGTRVNVPFPAVIEAFLMEITIEFLREAGTRISGPIGTTIGIVGGLIIGQAAVEAGIVSPLMIIIVAVTTVASFTIPSYEFAAALRFYRFFVMVLASILGLYGIMLGIILMLTHLADLNSFGIPFTSPFSGLGLNTGDLKDVLARVPMSRMRYRPTFTYPKDKKRIK